MSVKCAGVGCIYLSDRSGTVGVFVCIDVCQVSRGVCVWMLM